MRNAIAEGLAARGWPVPEDERDAVAQGAAAGFARGRPRRTLTRTREARRASQLDERQAEGVTTEQRDGVRNQLPGGLALDSSGRVVKR